MPYRSGSKRIAGLGELLDAAKAVPSGVVVGGLAMQLYGSDRLTSDVDLLFPNASSVPRGLRKVSRLSFGGFSTTAPNGITLDLIVRDDEWRKLYARAARAWTMKQGVRCTRIDYLAAMKLSSGRLKDQEDLVVLISLHPEAIKRMRATIKSELGAYAGQDFDSFVGEAEWRSSRDQRRGITRRRGRLGR